MSESSGIVIVGAGPAGATAAVTLAEAGVPSVLIDDNPKVGGQVFRTAPGNPPPSPCRDEDSRGPALREAVRRYRGVIDHRPGHQAVAVFPGARLGVLDDGGKLHEIVARALVLAPGALEIAVPVPGWTLPGVYTLGGLQILLKSAGVVPRRPVVLGGAGPLLFLVAAQLAGRGVEIAAVIDAAGWPTAADLAGMARRPGLLAKGIGYELALRRRGIAVHRRSAIAEISGDGRPREVAVAPLDGDWRPKPGPRRRLSAEVVGLGFGLRPNPELALSAGCAHDYDRGLGGWRPRLTAERESTVENLFVAGDGGGVAGVDAALADGVIVADAVARRLGLGDRGRLATLAAAARRRRDRVAPFRAALATWSGIRPGIFELAAADTVVCRCEDVTRADLNAAFAEGILVPGPVKLRTRAGMGLCQGRTCGPAVQALSALHGNLPIAALTPPSARPPLRPVPMAAIASLYREVEQQGNPNHGR